MKIRRSFVLLLLTTLLVACGGGALQLATGGIGGTGISTGSITAFGSIFVNGVEYDISQASLIRDGVPASSGQNEYQIGEYVTVKGTVNADGVTGTATEVVFNNELEGPVTLASTDGLSIEIMGQTVHTNLLTVFHGFTQLQAVLVGDSIEVSGIRDAQGHILASSLTLKPPTSMLEIYGTAQQVDMSSQTFRIGNLTVNYAGAALIGDVPVNGQYLEVKSVQDLQAGVLIASEVKQEQQYQVFAEGNKVELEGVISYFVSPASFVVNGQAITTNAQTVFEDSAASNLSLNALVEVDGTVNAQGVVVADEVSIRNSSGNQLVERAGTISSIDLVAKSFVLMSGNVITVDASTIWEDESAYAIAQMNFSYLNMGDFLEVKTKTLSDGKLLALRVQRKDGRG
jgi:hypothetical protein